MCFLNTILAHEINIALPRRGAKSSQCTVFIPIYRLIKKKARKTQGFYQSTGDHFFAYFFIRCQRLLLCVHLLKFMGAGFGGPPNRGPLFLTLVLLLVLFLVLLVILHQVLGGPRLVLAHFGGIELGIEKQCSSNLFFKFHLKASSCCKTF